MHLSRNLESLIQTWQMYHGQRDPTSPVEKRETYLMEVTRLTNRGFKRCCVIYKCHIQVSFTCVANGESRSRSAVTPSVCPSVRPKILSSQLLWNYWSDFHGTWYVDRTSYGVMHIGRKFWSPHFCGSYVPWNLENTYKWPCHCNSSETTDSFIMKLGM